MTAPAQPTSKSPNTAVFVILIILTVLFSPIGIISGGIYLAKGVRNAGLTLLILGIVLLVVGILIVHR